jgi:molecular chaperone DnaK
VFSTATESQTSVEVHVLQGERPMARDNRTLGRFHLVGLPPAPRGVPQIEVAFDIDANGIVNVSATDKATGKEQKITITGSSGLSKEDVARMVKDAEAHADEDTARRALIEARNQGEALVYAVEKSLGEATDTLPAGEVERVRAAVDAARTALTGEDLAAIRSAVDALQTASHRMAEALYKAPSSGPAQAPAGADAGVKDGEVIDAEYAETR